eukprot:487102-Rhodomonas_salina.2
MPYVSAHSPPLPLLFPSLPIFSVKRVPRNIFSRVDVISESRHVVSRCCAHLERLHEASDQPCLCPAPPLMQRQAQNHRTLELSSA